MRSLAAAAPLDWERHLLRLMWAAVIALSWLVILNTLPFFSFSPDFAFLQEKGKLATDPTWRTCFYMHISGGLVCLAVGPLLFWNGLLRRSKSAHRWLGRSYGLAVLGWAGPTGLYLAIHAKGGALGQIPFVIQGILWWWTTFHGVRSILAMRIVEHRLWMIRSYAMALSAVMFRIIHIALQETGMDPEFNYVISLWLTLVASVVVGEMIVQRYRALHTKEVSS